MSRRVAVVGAGIAGLTAAYELTRHPEIEVTVFEAGARVAGTVETLHFNGFTVECGPDSWVSDRPAARELAEELGLADHLIYSCDSQRRTYLAQGRTLTAMPDGMRMMVPTRWQPILESPLFSWTARLAYLRELKRAQELKDLARQRPADFDESVHDFVARHFGSEAAETIASPLLSGVFGGDVRQLSAGAVLAPFIRLEREHGSLITPMMARAREQQAAGTAQPLFTTLRGGLSLLVEGLAARLPKASLHLNAAVQSLHPAPQGWRLNVGPDSPVHFDQVVLATPMRVTRELLAPFAAEAALLLPEQATSAIVVALCFDVAASARMRVPRGFGFLTPKPRGGETPELLAGTFMHQKFPHRAPQGCVFLRGFFGGASASHMLSWDDDRIVKAAAAHFGSLLGPLPPHARAVVRRWPHSLPQYTVGHPQRMQRFAEHMRQHSGLQLTGNAYAGVGLSPVIGHARNAARQLPGQADEEVWSSEMLAVWQK